MHAVYTSADVRGELVQTVALWCEKYLRLDGARLGDEYFYQSLSLCVIDAVYSIGVRYKSVQNVVERYCRYFRLQRTRQLHDRFPAIAQQEPLSVLCEKMMKLGIERFTRDIFQNRQRTSSRGGILKAEAVFRFATVLTANGINLLQDTPTAINNVYLEQQLREIPGQNSGISIRYFFMLAGTEELIKPDRHITSFLKRCVGKCPSREESQFLLSQVCESLRSRYPHLTPRLLDNVIWNYERERSA